MTYIPLIGYAHALSSILKLFFCEDTRNFLCDLKQHSITVQPSPPRIHTEHELTRDDHHQRPEILKLASRGSKITWGEANKKDPRGVGL